MRSLLNHHFLLNIKFYTPIQKREQVDYVLNPNYNPNLIEYYKLIKDKNIQDRKYQYKIDKKLVVQGQTHGSVIPS